jgi:hypothetical protein
LPPPKPHAAAFPAILRPADPVGASAMGTVILIPELLELAWRNARPGREAAIPDELMRELQMKFVPALHQSAQDLRPTAATAV